MINTFILVISHVFVIKSFQNTLVYNIIEKFYVFWPVFLKLNPSLEASADISFEL